jgi:hypothetical protein
VSEQAVLVTHIVPLADGSGALVTYSILGVVSAYLVLSAEQVESFIRQWREVKKQEAEIHRAALSRVVG